jgi:hypothetical protein
MVYFSIITVVYFSIIIYNYVSPYAVKDIPESAKSWIEANRETFIKAGERGKLGSVWRENMKYVGKQFTKEELAKMCKTIN